MLQGEASFTGFLFDTADVFPLSLGQPFLFVSFRSLIRFVCHRVCSSKGLCPGSPVSHAKGQDLQNDEMIKLERRLPLWQRYACTNSPAERSLSTLLAAKTTPPRQRIEASMPSFRASELH